MPKNPHANFRPTLESYSGQGAFRFWCQMALPLTFDDSLSYYELLNKVVTYLNNTIEDVGKVEENVAALNEAYGKLEDYVNTYFDEIDIEGELRNILDAMAEDGSLDSLLDPLVAARLGDVVAEQISGVVANQIDNAVEEQIGGAVANNLPAVVPNAVSNWLKENITPTTPVVDNTLTISGAAADAKVAGDKITDLKNAITRTNKLIQKETVVEGYPFYKIKAPFTTERHNYYLNGTTWAQSSQWRYATDILPCPKYLMINAKNNTYALYVYIGDIVNGDFVVDQDFQLYATGSGVINLISQFPGLATVETNGSKYMWLGANKVDAFIDGYADLFDVIGADEWPESPIKPDAWSIYSGDINNDISSTSTTRKGYYLPEDSWVFVKDMTTPLLNFGVGASASKPWSSYRQNVAAFYIPEGSGMSMLTVGQSDTVTEANLCIIPKILDKSVSSNAIKVQKFANELLSKFRYTGQANSVNIATGKPIVIGKEYDTIPYSGRWNAQHMVGYDTTPETAANAANDPYSVFYDITEGRTETSTDGDNRPGYGGVCSTFASLATGSPYPQTIDGFFADKNFTISMLDNPRSGDVCLVKAPGVTEHAAFVDDVFENGYSLYEYAPPGIIKSLHTSGRTVLVENEKVSNSYLNNYNYLIQSKDRSGWKTNYLNFDYTIANGSIRPWRGNKSVCSYYNKMTTSASSLSVHTGIHITVHDGATTAYIKKPGGTVVSLDVTGQTVMNIGSIVDEAGTYELYSNVSETKEYFRYFTHTDVTLHLDEDGTAVFSSDDVDYAYVWCYGIDTEYPEVPTASPAVIAKGKKYPGVVIRAVKCAVVRDTTVVDGVEDSWGRYPVVCTAV